MLPFSGSDIWNAYELSWLDEDGKPVAAMGELIFPATSPSIIESKSLKLYLNSLSDVRYESTTLVTATVRADLSRASGSDVTVTIRPLGEEEPRPRGDLPGRCIDDADADISTYDLDPTLLCGSTDGAGEITESLHSHVFKTHCPVTGQPDWASILITYRGPRIRPARLLAYLVSYRNHAEFHEQCVERVFRDIGRHCRPRGLTVYARFMRRGGLDINPFRSNFEAAPENVLTLRQ